MTPAWTNHASKDSKTRSKSTSSSSEESEATSDSGSLYASSESSFCKIVEKKACHMSKASSRINIQNNCTCSFSSMEKDHGKMITVVIVPLLVIVSGHPTTMMNEIFHLFQMTRVMFPMIEARARNVVNMKRRKEEKVGKKMGIQHPLKLQVLYHL